MKRHHCMVTDIPCKRSKSFEFRWRCDSGICLYRTMTMRLRAVPVTDNTIVQEAHAISELYSECSFIVINLEKYQYNVYLFFTLNYIYDDCLPEI